MEAKIQVNAKWSGGFPRLKRAIPALLALCLASFAALYLSLLVPIRDGGLYAPSWNDEAGYCLRARSFMVNSSLKSPILMEERVSNLGGQGSHGLMYTAVYGAVASIGAFDPIDIVQANVFFVWIACGLVLLLLPLSMGYRLLAAILISSYFVSFMYAFTFMVESLQAPLSVAATLLLIAVHSRRAEGRRVAACAGVFLALLVVLSFFRVSYMLFAACLIPLATGRRQLLLGSAAFILCFAAVSLVVRQFSAVFPYGFLSKLSSSLGQGDAIGAAMLLFHNFALNAAKYFFFETRGWFVYMVFKYWIFAAAVYFLVSWFRERDRLALGAAALGFLNLFFLFAFYDAGDFREHRGLAPLFFSFVLFLAYMRRKWPLVLTFLLVAVSFPSAYLRTRDKIVEERVEVAREERREDKAARAFRDLGGYLEGDGDVVTVLLSSALKKRHGFLPSVLPLKNKDGIRIRYTYNQYTPPLERWGRIEVHYILAEPGAVVEGGVKRKTEWYELWDVRGGRHVTE